MSMAVFYYLKWVKLKTALIVIVYTILFGFVLILSLLLKDVEFSYYSYYLELQFLTLIFGLLLAVIVKPYHDLIIGSYNLLVSLICVILIEEFKVGTFLFYAGIVAFKSLISYLVFENVVELRVKTENDNLVISEQNSQLLELTNFRKNIIKVIAHDLRNPIHQISSLLDILAHSNTEKERAEIMSYVNASVSNAYELLEGLLKWVMKSDTSLNDFSVINVNTVIDEIENQLKMQLNKKELELVKIIKADAQVLYSKNIFETVVRNLLVNAIKFSSSNNDITVYFEDNATTFSIKVFNKTVNLSTDNIEKFNKGVTKLASVDGTAKEKGTGNGLTVCREMLKKNSGTLSLKVENEGVSATIKVEKSL